MKYNRSWCPKCRNYFVKSDVSEKDQEKRYEGLAKKTLMGYKKYDTKNGLETDLTIEDLIVLKKGKCYYCNRPATGADRINNDKGHTKDNIVPACVRCNWVRGNYLSHEVMLQVGELLKRIDP